jgi:peptide methionine sulfoxide reductase MsrB
MAATADERAAHGGGGALTVEREMALLQEFFELAVCPLDHAQENRMEELSFMAGGAAEKYRYHWAAGRYHCARCDCLLYRSADKWDGPCVWPSFRRGAVDVGEEDEKEEEEEEQQQQQKPDGRDVDENGGAAVVEPSAAGSASRPCLLTLKVPSYNGYKCRVYEVYCGGCRLFLGHKFEDGPAKGDKHPDARWRH